MRPTPLEVKYQGPSILEIYRDVVRSHCQAYQVTLEVSEESHGVEQAAFALFYDVASIAASGVEA